MHAAVAEVTTRFGTEVTVAFFPDKTRKAKQRKMYERNMMKDFMPVISEEKNEHLYKCVGLPLSLHTATPTATAACHSSSVIVDCETQLKGQVDSTIDSTILAKGR